MIVSWNWLNLYADLSGLCPKESALSFTMASAEIEEVHLPPSAQELQGLVVAKILECAPHPNADKLQVCQVFDGEKTIQIVCGAANARAGLHTILATIGTKLGDFTIKKAKLRGVESEGMLCSLKEVGLGKEDEGIAELDSSTQAGTAISTIFNDQGACWELDNKSITHRPDLWGHFGLAREVAGIFRRPLKELKKESLKTGSSESFKVSIEVPELCRRYCGLVLKGIEVKDSPLWIQKLLLEVGQKPINNVVDASNFVMLELGEPNHAFDLRRLPAQEILVTKANEGEEFISLTEKKVTLRSSDLVIRSGNEIVALAGVVGGENSAIASDTTEVFLEAAHFDAGTVRKTASVLDLRTDSSARFEKSLDPENAPVAIARIVTLLKETCPHLQIASDLIDCYPTPYAKRVLELDPAFVRHKLGLDLKDEVQADILKRMAFELEDGTNACWKVSVPTWRNTKDIEESIDLVEEIGRVFGYDNIPPKAPAPEAAPVQASAEFLQTRRLQDFLVERGFDEVMTYSFTNPEQAAQGDHDPKLLELMNPMSRDHSHLRISLLPQLLKVWADNAKNRERFQLFELGKVFLPRQNEILPNEFAELVAARYEPGDGKNTFYQLKADLLDLLYCLRAEDVELCPSPVPHPLAHPVRSADILVKGELVGQLAELHPAAAKKAGLKHRLSFFRLLNPTAWKQAKVDKFTPISRTPAVPFELSLLVPLRTPAGEVLKVLKEAGGQRLQDLRWEGNYQGASVEAAKVSMSFSMKFHHPEKTLVQEDIVALQETLVRAAAEKGFTLRQA